MSARIADPREQGSPVEQRHQVDEGTSPWGPVDLPQQGGGRDARIHPAEQPGRTPWEGDAGEGGSSRHVFEREVRELERTPGFACPTRAQATPRRQSTRVRATSVRRRDAEGPLDQARGRPSSPAVRL